MALNIRQTPQFIFGQVMHKRVQPKINQFNYKIYYLSLPLSKLSPAIETPYLKYNRFGLLSFYTKDHGHRDGEDLSKWVEGIFDTLDAIKPDGEIVLITMPRVFGYVFNPVSFFCCYDKQENLCAVICEVNNTFGESHSYLCLPNNGKYIENDDVITGHKLFHVSPFIEREGTYQFRFSLEEKIIGIWINHMDGENKPFLYTSVTGQNAEISMASSKKAFWCYPLVTFKAIFLIHWQAIKLIFKGIKYIPKPKQSNTKQSKTIE